MAGDPDRGFTRRQCGGWVYNVLPYIEQQALHDLGMGMSPTDKSAALDHHSADAAGNSDLSYPPPRCALSAIAITPTTPTRSLPPHTSTTRPIRAR